jgi:hypothetical protein
MPDLHDGFRQALVRLKDQIAEMETRSFDDTSLQDVQIAIIRIQRAQEHMNRLMNLQRVKVFLDRMASFEMTLSHILDRDDAKQLMDYVWGPFRFLLLVFSLSLTSQQIIQELVLTEGIR